jgi:aspartate kinase
MALVVQKYGGTSVGDADRIRNVARRLAARHKDGNQVVVVVSAMGKTTDELIDLAHQITDQPEAREMDVLLSTGEIVSTTLVAMALHVLGVDAISLTGAQAGLRTDAVHGRARILSLEPERVKRELEQGRVVIVAGFQGITEELEITTLGRGTSDLTPVALAAALGANRCEIFTDVEGIYTADPRVELGSVYDVPIVVASSMKETPGTLIHGGVNMEQFNRVRGIAHDKDVAKVTVRGVPDQPGIAAGIFGPLADNHVSVDIIVQNASIEQLTDLTFTVAVGDLQTAVSVVEGLAKEIGAGEVVTDDGLGKVSIVGTGIRSAPGYAARMFNTLSEAGINIEMISTSEIRITCIVCERDVDKAVQELHKAFELEKAEVSEL